MDVKVKDQWGYLNLYDVSTGLYRHVRGGGGGGAGGLVLGQRL